jgi:hypothetical protein
MKLTISIVSNQVERSIMMTQGRSEDSTRCEQLSIIDTVRRRQAMTDNIPVDQILRMVYGQTGEVLK